MATRLRCKEYTFGSTAPVNMTTVFGLSGTDYISTLVMRAKKSNAGDVVWGEQDLTTTTNRGGFLSGGDAAGWDLVQKFVATKDLYIAGQPGDTLHITWLQ